MRIIRQSTRGIRYISQFGLSLSQNNNPNQLNWCCDLWLWFEIKRSKCGWCCCVPPAVVLTLTNVVVSFYVLLLRGNSGSFLNESHHPIHFQLFPILYPIKMEGDAGQKKLIFLGAPHSTFKLRNINFPMLIILLVEKQSFSKI